MAKEQGGDWAEAKRRLSGCGTPFVSGTAMK